MTPSNNAGAGTCHPIDIRARTEGSLMTVDKIPVYVTLTMNGDGQLLGHLSATGSINTLTVTATSFYLEPESLTPADALSMPTSGWTNQTKHCTSLPMKLIAETGSAG